MGKILLIAPTFFGYRDRVRDELVRLGYDVQCIDDRPSESISFKSVAKVSYKFAENKISHHAHAVCSVLSRESFEYVIVMGGMSFCFTRPQFEEIKKNSNARFVAYIWDSFANCQRFGKCCDLFDDVYSFEPSDCEHKGLKFRPLFYSQAYMNMPLEPPGGFDYDACFIGSVHQASKFDMVKRICDNLENNGRKVFTYFYVPSKSAELLCKMTNRSYRGIKFRHTSISASRIADIYSRSRAVIDSPQAGQQGLTMRTLETIGARRKLITVNSDIRRYDFYTTGNVFVSKDGSIPSDSFFLKKTSELKPDVYASYSITTFVKTLLSQGCEYQGYRRYPQ